MKNIFATGQNYSRKSCDLPKFSGTRGEQVMQRLRKKLGLLRWDKNTFVTLKLLFVFSSSIIIK
jgi:hypothetical protein